MWSTIHKGTPRRERCSPSPSDAAGLGRRVVVELTSKATKKGAPPRVREPADCSRPEQYAVQVKTRNKPIFMYICAADRRALGYPARPAREKNGVHLILWLRTPRTEAERLEVSKPCSVSDILITILLVSNVVPLCAKQNGSKRNRSSAFITYVPVVVWRSVDLCLACAPSGLKYVRSVESFTSGVKGAGS